MVHHRECTKLIRLEPKSSVVFLLDAEGHLLYNIDRAISRNLGPTSEI
jgi:hypothetical protein